MAGWFSTAISVSREISGGSGGLYPHIRRNTTNSNRVRSASLQYGVLAAGIRFNAGKAIENIRLQLETRVAACDLRTAEAGGPGSAYRG